MFWIVLALLFIISFLMALLSLKKELSTSREVKKAQEELMKEKVLFIKD